MTACPAKYQDVEPHDQAHEWSVRIFVEPMPFSEKEEVP